MKFSGIYNYLTGRFGRRTSRTKMSPTNAEYEYLKKKINMLERLLDEKTQSVDKAKSIFLKNIYHEIRTPLNSIVGFSDLIEMNNLSVKDKTTYISHIRESSKEFLQKMDNIIEASILEAGLLKITSSECSIYDLVNEVYSYFSIHKHIIEKRIAFLLNIPEETKNLKINCDSFRLTQVLTNLLSNAFKFTDRGTIELGYRLKGKEIEFFVIDTGRGITNDKKSSVFNNFTKLEESDNTMEGLGLGLGLSKKMIELMKGRIWYRPNQSRGTSFYFTIPFISVKTTPEDISKSKDNKTISPNFAYSLRRSVIL